MGLVLDSSVLIAAERNVTSVSELLEALEQLQGETEIVLCSITVIELEHGLHRANTPERTQKAAGVPGYRFCRDPSRAVYRGNGPDRGED
jgi:predicted nucleic acid-binding protein